MANRIAVNAEERVKWYLALSLTHAAYRDLLEQTGVQNEDELIPPELGQEIASGLAALTNDLQRQEEANQQPRDKNDGEHSAPGQTGDDGGYSGQDQTRKE